MRVHTSSMSVFIHPYTHTVKRQEGRVRVEGREGGRERGREYKGQYAGKHLHGIETMSRFQVARGQFFRGVVLKHLGSVDVQSQHP